MQNKTTQTIVIKIVSIMFAFIFPFIPMSAIAAGNDVTLTTDAVVIAGGYTVDVSGSSATVQSITVNPTDFTVTLASGSSITMTAPGLNELNNDTSSDVASSTCTAATSSLTLSYSGGGTVTNTITPSSTLCSGGTAAPTTYTLSYAAGANGTLTGSTTQIVTNGSSGTAVAAVPNSGYHFVNWSDGSTANPRTDTGVTGNITVSVNFALTAVTPTSTPTPSTSPSTSGSVSSSGGSISVAQLAQILAPSASTTAYLNSLTAEATSSSAPAATPSAVTVVPSPNFFVEGLHVGSIGSDVKYLQQFLNANGYVIAVSGLGSPGNETTKFGNATKAALMKFQKAHGITATGMVGPLTLQALENSSSQLPSATSSSAVTPAVTPATVMSTTTLSASYSFTRNLQVGDIGSDIKILQQFLNANGYVIAVSGPGSHGNETTKFGNATKAALMKFQKAHGIPTTGILGPKTAAAIEALM